MDRPGFLRRALVGGASLLTLVMLSGGSVERNSHTGPVSIARQDSSAVVAAVGRFHSALAAGDSAAALALLAPDAIIVESGAVQSRVEYRAHHLAADIEFTRAVPSVRSSLRAVLQGDAAWVTGTSTTKGVFNGRGIDSSGAELMVLTRTRTGWTIRAIHWSSRSRRPT